LCEKPPPASAFKRGSKSRSVEKGKKKKERKKERKTNKDKQRAKHASRSFFLSSRLENPISEKSPGELQLGSGWWFVDQKEGVEWKLNALSNCGLLSRFIGIFVSYPRHEYFRRVGQRTHRENDRKYLLRQRRKLLGAARRSAKLQIFRSPRRSSLRIRDESVPPNLPQAPGGPRASCFC
jgi:hypothetical protein